MTLVSGLSSDTSRFLTMIKESSLSVQLDRAMGRDPDRPKRRVSVDDFLKDVG